MGPLWPYPTIKRNKTDDEDYASGCTFIQIAILLLLCSLLGMGIEFILYGSVDFLPEKNFNCSSFLPGVPVLLIIGAVSMFESKRAFNRLVREGICCWGRVISVEQTDNIPATTRSTSVLIHVELFAAHVANWQTSHSVPGGTRVNNNMGFCWSIANSKISYVQPGAWCALLVHPHDHSKVFLDGFATQDGQFVPKQ